MSPAPLTYEQVARLLTAEAVRGNVLHCRFLCPRSQQVVDSRAVLHHDGLKNHHPLYDVVAASVANQEAPSAVASVAQRRAAVLTAFRSAFVWGGDPPGWMSRQAAEKHLPGFARQLQLHPVEKGFDRFLLARILSEVMRADGRVVPEELGFMQAYRSIGRTLAELADQPDLKASDLAGASPGGVRDTLLMLAWALALVDLSLDPAELALLKRISEGLGLTPARAGELLQHARAHLA